MSRKWRLRTHRGLFCPSTLLWLESWIMDQGMSAICLECPSVPSQDPVPERHMRHQGVTFIQNVLECSGDSTVYNLGTRAAIKAQGRGGMTSISCHTKRVVGKRALMPLSEEPHCLWNDCWNRPPCWTRFTQAKDL